MTTIQRRILRVQNVCAKTQRHFKSATNRLSIYTSLVSVIKYTFFVSRKCLTNQCPLPVLLRDAMLSQDACLSVCLSVCPSVCPTHADIVSKRLKIASNFLHYRIATPFKFLYTKRYDSTRTGMYGCEKNAIFLQMSCFISEIIQTRRRQLLRNANRKLYPSFRMVSFSIILSEPRYQSGDIIQRQITRKWYKIELGLLTMADQ